jgi:hypothetical protein
MSALLFLLFTVALFTATAAAVTGTRGQVCERGVGYTVPAAVEADPALNARANRLVATWGTAAAVLSAVPLVALALHGFDRDLPLWALLALAAWGFVVVVVGGYPFEQIKQLGSPQERHPAS